MTPDVKRRALAAGLIASIALAASVTARVTSSPGGRDAARSGQQPASRRADAVFARWNRPDSPGCSAAVSRRGAVVYARGFGAANLEYATPITPASVFHVASVSKQFTAMSILLLAQQGKLSLDDEVRTHVPEWMDTEQRVTIRHLLTHTSGVRDVFLLTEMAAPGDRGLGTARWLVSLMARQRHLNFAPGSEFQYNNGGYLLLAEIVARVSGQSLPEFARTHIFQPLGMTQTFFHDDASTIVRHRATGYVRRPTGLAIAIGFDSLVGNGGLFTTPRDLLRWEHNFVEPRVGTAPLLRSMEAPTPLTSGGTSPYGFGLQIAEYRGRRAFGHGGGDPGTSAHTLRFPDDALAVAVACNIEEIDSFAVALDLADVFLGKRPPAATAAPPPIALTEEQLSRQTGLYRDPSTQFLLRMFMRDGNLMGSPGNGTEGGWAVAAVSETSFAIPTTPITLEFHPDESGRAQSLRIIGEKPQPFTLQRLPDQFHPPRSTMTALSGRYANAELDVAYTLAVHGDELLLQIPNRKSLVMQPIAHDAFVASYLGVLNVSRDASGTVTGFTSHSPGVREIRFEREK